MFTLLLVACHDLPMTTVDDGKVATTSPEGDPCTYAETPVAWDDTTLGFTPDAVLAFVGARVETLTYADETTTTELHLDAAGGGDPLLLTATPIDGATSCPDPTVRVPIDVQFTTTDGAFDLLLSDVVVVDATWAQDSLFVDGGAAITDNAGSFTHSGASDWSVPLNYLPTSSIGEVIAVREGGEEDAAYECGVAAWGAPLQTGCPE